MPAYSPRLTALFRERRHDGMLEGATHRGAAGTPGQGPYAELLLRVEDGVVSAARYRTYGCPAVIACLEALCRRLEGGPLAAALRVTPEELEEWVDRVPEEKGHCPRLVCDAARSLRPLAPAGG
jgi:NifU-like protein involved in Fe-S cluster formation